jgi:ELWxxDGT repeat protein
MRKIILILTILFCLDNYSQTYIPIRSDYVEGEPVLADNNYVYFTARKGTTVPNYSTDYYDVFRIDKQTNLITQLTYFNYIGVLGASNATPPSNFQFYNGDIYFSDRNTLYRISGVSGAVSEIYTSPIIGSGSFVDHVFCGINKVFFRFGQEYSSLYVYDTLTNVTNELTVQGLVSLKNANQFVEFNNNVYFVATRADSSNATYIHFTDGTSANTGSNHRLAGSYLFGKVNNANVSKNVERGLNCNGNLIFYANADGNGSQTSYVSLTIEPYRAYYTLLWRGDGNPKLFYLNGLAYLSNGSTFLSTNGVETPINTGLSSVNFRGTSAANSYSSGGTGDYLIYNSKVYGSLEIEANIGRELYSSDGTADGTQIVKDINISSGHSAPRLAIVHNNKMYFTANNGGDHYLHQSDGTEAGTNVIFENLSSIRSIVGVDNYLYVYGNSGGYKGLFKLNLHSLAPLPTANPQLFCNTATIANLVATGQNLKWYNAEANGSPLEDTIALATGTYYVSQTINGNESARISVLVTVNPNVPTFTQVAPICSGASLEALPTTSTNAISGTWSPALNNTSTTSYTFTPAIGQCASTQTMTITVNQKVTPVFTQVAPISAGGSLAALPTTSTNSIKGTWSPALNNTTTTTYSFTPILGECATIQTMTITVHPNIGSTFTVDGINYIVTKATLPYEVAVGNNKFVGVATIPTTVSNTGNSFVVTSIYKNAFYNSGLTSITIPNSVTSIGEGAFGSCQSLTTVNIPNSVTTISDVAFNSCISLTSITIPESVTTLGEGVFINCIRLTSVNIPTSITSIGAYMFSSCTSLTSVTIPTSVASIGAYTFQNCSGLTSIAIPNSVASIADYSFSGCTGLTSIAVNWTTPLTINANVFNGLNLSTITLNVPAGTETAYKDALVWREFGAPSLNQTFTSNGINYIVTKATLPYEVAVSTNTNFAGAASIPANVTNAGNSFVVTSIGDGAFYAQERLTSVTIPISVKSIGVQAFSGCWGLTSVTISSSVSSIGTSAFAGCTGLTSVTIPNSVTSIGDYAFLDCINITTVTMNSHTPLDMSNSGFAFSSSYMDDSSSIYYHSYTSGTNLVVPAGASEAYRFASVWKDFGTIVEAPQLLYTAIPDANFEKALFDQGIDTVNGDKQVLTSAISVITSLDISNKNISDLTGIEGFRALHYLYCNQNQLTSLNMNDLPALNFLNCASNQLTGLNLNLLGLNYLNCSNNQLTSLNLNSLPMLVDLNCSNNQLTSLNYKSMYSLRSLYCQVNSLTSLDLSGFRALDKLNCSNNQLNGIDLYGLPALNEVNCSNNQLTSLNFYDLPALNFLNCAGNQLTSLNVDGLADLTSFYCGGNQLTSLNLSMLKDLLDLDCVGNQLTSLNVSASTELWSLKCTGNGLTSLDVSGCTDLRYLHCRNNQLTRLDLTGLKYLTTLECLQNSLTSLDLNGLTALSDLNCRSNELTSLDLSGLAALQNLFCDQNPSLTCITVTDPTAAVANGNWIKDAKANYSTNCGGGVIETFTSNGINYIVTKATVPYEVAVGSNPDFVGAATIPAIVTNAGNSFAVTSISNNAFAYCVGLTSVTIPSSVTSIGNNAFSGSTSLSAVTIPNSVSSIGSVAFGNCQALTSVTIPNSVISISSDTFNSCINLASVTIPDSVTSIGDRAFSSCTSLTSLTIPNSVLSIGESAFSDLHSLTSINIPNSVTSIGDYAFSNCIGLTEVTVNWITPLLINFTVFDELYLPSILLKVPAETETTYNNDVVWTYFRSLSDVVNYCKGAIATPLTSPFGDGSTVKWYTTASGGRALTTAPKPTTSTVGTKLFYVSEVVDDEESDRVTITVNTFALPATPGTISGTAAQGTLVGTTNTATYSIAEVAGASSYAWTAPTGVNIVSGQGTNEITVNFATVPDGTGAIGNLSVVAINSNDCSSLVRSLALTKALPTAPAAIKMTDDLLPIPVSGIPTAVSSFAQYMGTSKVLTLTATPSLTATSYEWELPAGVNQLSGGTSNIITVNFAGVTSDNTHNYTAIAAVPVATNVLRIGVKAKNGTGTSVTANGTLLDPPTTSTARLLTLKAVLPTAPSAIKMTDADAVDPSKAVTAVSNFIGTSKVFTLTATPSATAISYSWELPAGVNQISGGNSNVITVNFAGVGSGISSLYIGVKAVNGLGSSVTTTNGSLVPATSSTAKLLKLTTSVPTAPAAIKMTNPLLPIPVSGVPTAVTVISKYIGTTTVFTLTATPSPLASSYTWELPAGVTQLSGGNTNEITVNFAGVGSGISSLYIGVKAVNGLGSSVTTTNGSLVPATSSTAKLLKLTAAVPATVSVVTGQIVGLCGGSTYSYTITPSILANTYQITAPIGALVKSASNMTNTNNVLTTPDLSFTVTYPAGFVATTAAPKSIAITSVNGVGTSLTSKTFTLSTLMPAIGVAVGGTTFTRCANQTFSIPTVVGATNYIWTVADSAVIVSGQGTNSVVIDFSAVPALKTTNLLKVVAQNSCGVSSTVKSISLRSTSCSSAKYSAPKDNGEIAESTTYSEVYPNPASDSFSIDVLASQSGVLEMTIYSLNGAIVVSPKEVELKEGNNTITTTISSLTRGTYIVQFVNSSTNDLITKKLLKQ